MLHRASELVDFCERGNEHSGNIKGGEFLDKLSDYKFYKFSRRMQLHGVSELVS